MLFGRRIGFSGTPSDLMPIELGLCGYEKGTMLTFFSALFSLLRSNLLLPELIL